MEKSNYHLFRVEEEEFKAIKDLIQEEVWVEAMEVSGPPSQHTSQLLEGSVCHNTEATNMVQEVE